MQENKLRWFGYVYHRLVDAVGRKGDIVMLDGSNNGRDQNDFISGSSKRLRYLGYHGS